MLTFLGEDEIPWNNNAAARTASSDCPAQDLGGFLKARSQALLATTCNRTDTSLQNKSFLGFLLSGLTDVD
jgi:hypothetical protein